MKLKSISFSSPMVQAIVDGTKNQTRRIIKPQPDTSDGRPLTIWYGWPSLACSGETHHNITPPYGKPGDILMVKEPHRILTDLSKPSSGTISVEYSNTPTKGDDNYYYVQYSEIHPDTMTGLKARKSGPTRWVKGRYLPNDLVRLFLLNKGVRVEPLQDISVRDALDEGILRRDNYCLDYLTGDYTFMETSNVKIDGKWVPAEVCSYRSLWESINGVGSWKLNPWVWIVDFERTAKPANQ